LQILIVKNAKNKLFQTINKFDGRHFWLARQLHLVDFVAAIVKTNNELT
jgi:hypothetical protein